MSPLVTSSDVYRPAASARGLPALSAAGLLTLLLISP
jgi:hypothetical protein